MIRSTLILLAAFSFSPTFAQQNARDKSTLSTNPKVAYKELTIKAIPAKEYNQKSDHKIVVSNNPGIHQMEENHIRIATFTAIPASTRTIKGSSHKKIVTVIDENSQTITTEKNSNLTQISSEKKPTMRHHEATKASTKVMSTEPPKRVIIQTIETEKNHEE